MNKLKKGFTLIELLAVIVILAIIALITVPIVLGVVDDAKEKSFKESLRFVIDATNNFVAFNPYDSIPKEGIPVMDERIKMNNKSFKTGMAFINKDNEVELDFVSNGEYCGAGTKNNIIIVKGSCNKLDKTTPVINSVNALAKGSSEIEVTVSALDPESGIKEYYYSLNNGNYVKVNSNKFSIKNLDSNKEYKIKVKVLNGNNLETISEEVSVKTVELVIPTFTLDKEGWQKQRKVTINYNEGYILKYSYSLDNGVTWIEVTNNPVITLTENKVIIAKISDGTNHLTSTYQETQIDNTAPKCGSITGQSKTWTSADRTITVGCSDNGECSKTIFSNTFNTTTETSNILITDKAGNETTCPVDVYVDKTKYSISINQLKPGNLTTNVSSAMRDESVTITATPTNQKDGFYTGASLSTGTTLDKDTLTFKMPGENITVTPKWGLWLYNNYEVKKTDIMSSFTYNGYDVPASSNAKITVQLPSVPSAKDYSIFYYTPETWDYTSRCMKLRTPNTVNFGDYKKIYVNGYTSVVADYDGVAQIELLTSANVTLGYVTQSLMVGKETSSDALTPYDLTPIKESVYLNVSICSIKKYGYTTSATMTKLWIET